MTQNDILVVGDVYVDADWVVAPHDSEFASRAGEHHYLAVHNIGATVRSLGGAGLVASILHERWPRRKVFCLGSWASGDCGYIQGLLHRRNKGDNPLRLSPRIARESLNSRGSRRVFNLSDGDRSAGTNRVIRVYRRSSASDYRLIDRIDFAVKPAPPRVPDLPRTIGHILIRDNGHGLVTRRFVEQLLKRFPRAAYYVATKRWPTATGDDRQWLDLLNTKRFRLLLLHPEAAARATILDDNVYPEVGNWFLEDRVPSRRALEAIDVVAARLNISKPAIVVAPARGSLVARLHTVSGTRGFVRFQAADSQRELFVPRSSALFAALFSEATILRYTDKSLDRAAGLADAWVSAEARRLFGDTSGSQRPKSSLTRSGPAATAGRRLPRGPVRPARCAPFDWDHVDEEYKRAFVAWPRTATRTDGFGLIRRNKHHYLDLWRAKSVVSGVVSIVRAKRRMLALLSAEFDSFLRSKRTSRSYLVVDDPGGGKSTLVKSLAASKGLRVLTVNITELTKRGDLLAFFDGVVTTQAQDPEQPLLIFVDEINALLEGHSVYSSFLAPLEDGHYNRDGKAFLIRPCIWVFVGTDDLSRERLRRRDVDGPYSIDRLFSDISHVFGDTPAQRIGTGRRNSDSDDEAHRVDRSQKKSDFLSRLTSPPFVLNQEFTLPEDGGRLVTEVLAETERMRDKGYDWHALVADVDGRDSPDRSARRLLGRRLLREGHALERVYIGAAMMTGMYPSVQRISLRVLAALAYLDDSYSLRDLRHDLERLTNVQNNQIRWANLPGAFHRRRGFWRLSPDGRLERDFYGHSEPVSQICGEELDGILVEVQRSVPLDEDGWTGLPASTIRGSRTR